MGFYYKGFPSNQFNFNINSISLLKVLLEPKSSNSAQWSDNVYRANFFQIIIRSTVCTFFSCDISMPTPDPPAIENTKFQSQYGISRKGSGVGIEMSQEKKVHTVGFEQSESAIEKHLIMQFLLLIQINTIIGSLSQIYLLYQKFKNNVYKLGKMSHIHGKGNVHIWQDNTFAVYPNRKI